MFPMSLELVRSRRSVRTFDGAPLRKEHLAALSAWTESAQNPYGIPVEFRLLDAKEHGLSSPVISGAQLYLAAKVKRIDHAEEAYGYCFESLVLLAQSLGIGTVLIGGTMNRAAFQKAMSLSAEEMMPCVTPLGYPAKKPSVKESLMRKGTKADTRLPFGSLFFDGSFDKPLTEGRAGVLRDALEAVRWAPSAVNRQPWRVVVTDAAAHFYKKGVKGYTGSATGDLQKIDLGIALCHFDLMLKASGRAAALVTDDPGLPAEAGTEYIASYAFGL